MRIRSLVDGVLSPEEATMQALMERGRRSQGLPFLLSYAPVAEMNPFQRLLYCRASEAGFALVPAVDFRHLGAVGWAGRSVIHLHWLASILAGATGIDDASARIARFRNTLVSWRAAGHSVVWTMHNVLPHEAAMPEAEIELRRVIIEQADAVHLLSEASIEEAAGFYELPEAKTFHVPHPSYEGWYANTGDRANARLDLELSPNEFTFVSFGSLQRYKGLVELIDAFQQVSLKRTDRRMRLLIAGKAVDRDYHAELAAKAASVHGVTLLPSAMEERQVQTLMNGADAVVAPYLRTLNSGAALLAASFRRPLVAPSTGGVAETFGSATGLLYSGSEGDMLSDAMERAMASRIEGWVFDEILKRHRPETISRMFFAEIGRRCVAREAREGVQ